MTTTAAQRHGSGGLRRTGGGDAPGATRGWWSSTATGGATRASSTWSCATARSWSPARSRPAPATSAGPRTRPWTTPRSSGCTGCCGAGARSTTSGRARPGSTWSASCRARRGRRAGRPRAGARLMPFATTHCGLARRRHRSPHRRPGRRVARAGRHRARRPARPGAQRGPRPVPDGDHQQRASTGRNTRRMTILLSPADLPKRGTHFDLAIAVAVLGALDVVPEGVAGGHRPHRRAHPVRRPAVGARASCRWCSAPGSAASPG